jgi:O-antigen ligase
MLVGVVIAVVMVFINLAMPHRIRLIGVALLLIPQLYLPGLPASLAVLWTLITCLAGLIARGRSRADSPLVVIMGLFLTVTAVSLLWAVPTAISDGVETVVRGVVFLLWLREVIVLAKDEPGLLDTIVLWTVPGVAVQSVLSIVFQVSPASEDRFLHSGSVAVITGPRVEHLYSDMPNNVIAATKSGGVFLNGNVASLFGGIAALMLIIAARRTTHRWLHLFAALSVAGSAFTGSKSVLIVGTGCAVVTLFLPHMLKGRAALVGLPIVLLVPLMYFVVTEFLEGVAPTFYAAADRSFSGREELWTRAGQMFQESPVLGLGFGGWLEQVGKVGWRTDLPPHNLIVAAWASSGIVAAVLAIVFMVAAIAFGLRVAAAQSTVRDRRTAVLALSAIVWVFSHGMADNTTVYGETRSMILVGLAFGYLYAMVRGRPQEPVGFVNAGNFAGSSVANMSPRTH